jgi:hypothetical protein
MITGNMLSPTECRSKAIEAREAALLTKDGEARALWTQSEALWGRLADMGAAQEALQELTVREPDRR